MTLQNRSRPDGTLTANPARGMFMGNRGGRFHDPKTRTLSDRPWVSKRWICCVCDFKNRHREVMGKSYTEVFFPDEVTALAAGHRPCFECRREDANAFASAFGEGNPGLETDANAMDEAIHPRRRLVMDTKPQALSAIDLPGLPDGTMVEAGGRFFALRGRRPLHWSPSGYGPAGSLGDLVRSPATLVTPKPIINALKAGYRPEWHGSAT